ncbi:acyltransferase family protein [Microbaculum marinum]|uniref:Acyltransferase family protein n=1 Tax=Microbaculum marinum TaxID=1764581 RepID=A0AAW9RQI3_9HYPH
MSFQAATVPSHGGRVDWVDIAKGFCIIMVVMMHSTLGVEKAAGVDGWMHPLVEFARPFRMPDFFLVAGLFLARRIDRPWPEYMDRKVLHFAYFYVLWMAIQIFLKTGLNGDGGFRAIPGDLLFGLVQPYGTLWFIYLLPVFFVVTKCVRRVPPAIVLVIGALLQVAQVETGWIVADEFASRFVFFYAGYALAPWIFSFASRVRENPRIALGGLILWALLNGWLVAEGLADLPVVSLALAGLGAMAVVSGSALLAGTFAARPLRYCGENSIVIYLAFFLPMAVTRIVLLKLELVPDIGTVSLIVTAAGVVGPLILYRIVRGTWFGFLFRRPGWARHRAARGLAPAE